MSITIIKGLYPILDTSIIPLADIKRCALRILAAGVKIIQLRAKGVSSKEFLNAAITLRELTEERGATFIINDRVDIALISKADGVHIGQRDLPYREARMLLGEARIIGVSTHNLKEAINAQDDGADYISFGPILSTTTKQDTDQPKGVMKLKELKARVNIPVVAIGGIKEDNLREVMESGVDAVAMISEILMTPDITEKTLRLLKKLS
ncbi:MAG: thiamine phosphate synthase [Thermodesulfobacteriota bacterium]